MSYKMYLRRINNVKELDEMSVGQEFYDYECKSCGFTKGIPEFLIEEFRQDVIFETETITPLEDKSCQN